MLTSSPDVRKLVQAASRIEVFAKVWPACKGSMRIDIPEDIWSGSVSR